MRVFLFDHLALRLDQCRGFSFSPISHALVFLPSQNPSPKSQFDEDRGIIRMNDDNQADVASSLNILIICLTCWITLQFDHG